MASRFAVNINGSVTWSSSDTSIWAASSGGASGASVPVAGDTVTLDSASGTGTLTLNYNPTIAAFSMATFGGTFDLGGFSPTMSTFSMSGAGTKTFIGGTGTLTLTGTGTVFDSGGAGVTCSMANLTLAITDVSSTSKALSTGNAGGSNIFGTITLTPGGSGTFTFNSNPRTITTLNITGPKNVVFTSSTTTTVTNWNVNGASGIPVVITATTPGTAATISIASGTVNSRFLSLRDSAATGGATFNVLDSVNVSGNTGWNFFYGRAPVSGRVAATNRATATGRVAETNRVQSNFNPFALTTSCFAWWDVASNIVFGTGTAVASWTDRVSGLVMTQATNSKRPTLSALPQGGNVFFNYNTATQRTLEAPMTALDSLSGFTISTVFLAAGTVVNQVLAAASNSVGTIQIFANRIYAYAGTGIYGSAAFTDSTRPHVYTAVFDGSLSGNANRFKLYIDGVQQTLSFIGTVPATTTTGQTSYALGDIVADPVAPYNGSMGDFIMFNEAVSSDVRSQTELYLARKFNVALT